MTAVVQERQPTIVQARKRPDAQNDVEQDDRGGSEGADQDDLQGGRGVQQQGDASEQDHVGDDAREQHEVVALLERVPQDRLVTRAHDLP